MKPTIKIHNTETNEIIEREMTDEEISALNPPSSSQEPPEEQ